MQFSNPIWLWGLTALAVPVAIHLLSRQEGKTIPMGSLRYLTESPTARFRHIKLNELLLLFLRCLLIVLMVMVLAGAQFVDWNTKGKAWLLTEPGIESDPAIRTLVDSLNTAGFEQHALTDFTNHNDSSEFGYWTLAERLRSAQIDTAIVLAYNYQTKFIGPKTSLPPQVNWITVAPPKFEGDVINIKTSGDSLWIRSVTSDASQTQFNTRNSFAPQRSGTETVQDINVKIYSSPAFEYDAKIILASLNALKSVSPHILTVEIQSSGDVRPESANWIFWLSDDPYPGSSSANTIAFSSCESEDLNVLVESEDVFNLCKSNPADWLITQRLTEEIAVDENLTAMLASIILPEKNIHEVDKRVMPESMVWSKLSPTRERKQLHGDSAEPYLLSFLLLILATERLLAFRRNQ